MKPRVTLLVGLSLLCLATVARAPRAQSANEVSALVSAELRNSLEDSGGKPVKVWIYFRNHGERDASDIEVLLSDVKLTSRSLERRARRSHREIVDARDLPVSPEYLDAVRGLGCRIRQSSKYLNAASATATSEQISRLSRLPFVTRIERVQTSRRQLPDTRWLASPMTDRNGRRPIPDRDVLLQRTAEDSVSYGLSDFQNRQIDVPPLHNAGFHGEGVVVALLDTGFRRINDALAHVNVVAEWDFVDNDPVTSQEPGDPAYQDMHGSLSLGTIASFLPGGVIGPAWAADYILAKTERYDRELMLEEDNFVRALEWADSLGADVVSSSLGYFLWYTYPDMDGDTAVTTRAADIAASHGILVVTAAGNEGPLPWPGIIAPADGDSVIAVGAADSLGGPTSYSSRGPTYDGRIKPDVLAMGQIVASINWQQKSGFWAFGGTSAAAPLAAGACALILQMNPEWSPMDVRQALWSTASHAEHPDNEFGWGVVDAFAAARAGQPQIVAFDVYPGSCRNPFNPANRGRVPAVLFGSVDLDAKDIDVSSLRLLGRAVPVTSKIGDRGSARAAGPQGCPETTPDGIDDLVLHFDAEAIADALAGVREGRSATLTLTGKTFEGNPIEGETAVTIVGREGRPGEAPVSADEGRSNALGDAVPNPFNPVTRIPYTLASDEVVRLFVYDVTGRLVERLVDGPQLAGDHAAEWDARGFPSGIYFYRIEVGSFAATRKLAILK